MEILQAAWDVAVQVYPIIGVSVVEMANIVKQRLGGTKLPALVRFGLALAISGVVKFMPTMPTEANPEALGAALSAFVLAVLATVGARDSAKAITKEVVAVVKKKGTL